MNYILFTVETTVEINEQNIAEQTIRNIFPETQKNLFWLIYCKNIAK